MCFERKICICGDHSEERVSRSYCINIMAHFIINIHWPKNIGQRVLVWTGKDRGVDRGSCMLYNGILSHMLLLKFQCQWETNHFNLNVNTFYSITNECSYFWPPYRLRNCAIGMNKERTDNRLTRNEKKGEMVVHIMIMNTKAST